jgi:cell division septation protein DedD
MSKESGRETELVLETKQLLGVLLGIALLCGVFFVLGFLAGDSSGAAPETAPPSEEEITHSGEKPSAMTAPAYIPRNPAAASASSGETDLNFYQSVEEKEPEAKLDGTVASGEGAPAALPIQPPPGILVQVSALTRREDAESLVGLLQERKLPVLVTSGENDALFHVVVGPYENEQAAERVKELLEREGFRPFVRRR